MFNLTLYFAQNVTLKWTEEETTVNLVVDLVSIGFLSMTFLCIIICWKLDDNEFACAHWYKSPKCAKDGCHFLHIISTLAAVSRWPMTTMHLVILSFELSSTCVLLMCTQSWMNRHLLKNYVFCSWCMNNSLKNDSRKTT